MIKTQSKDLEYFINESNEASSDKTSLDLALCKQNMKPDIWYQNCIDPGLFVGWYISTVYEENRILQTKNGKNLEKNLGICYFEEKTFVGFLIFIKNLNFVEVFGASNVWGNVSIIANKEYWLETEKITPDKNRIHGKISEKSWSKPGFTLIYCSPEQIKGHNPDKKSDVWSFGMTIYSFLTHLSPYDYLTNNGKKKLDKNEYYNEIYYNKRIPKIPDNFKIQYPGIFKLMEDMWKTDPEQRPNIKQVRQSLVNFFLQI